MESARAQLEDLGAVHAIALTSLPEAWSPALFAEALRRDDADVWVVRDADATPVGYLVSQCLPDCLEVQSMAVAPWQRRRGVAKALLQEVRRRAEREQLDAIQLELRVSNQVARRCYEQNGFRVVGRRRRYYSNGEDAWLMTCDLREARCA